MTKSPRAFELRTYHANPGKLDALHARFRDHTLALFAQHGIEVIGFWTPSDSATNTLVYLLAFPDREAATARWAAFQADPAWKAAKASTEVDGPLTASIESVFLSATDYSPLV